MLRGGSWRSHGSLHMPTVLIATSNAGKLRDFAGAAGPFGGMISGIPDFHLLPRAGAEGPAFEDQASKKALEYTLHLPGENHLPRDPGLGCASLDDATHAH